MSSTTKLSTVYDAGTWSGLGVDQDALGPVEPQDAGLLRVLEASVPPWNFPAAGTSSTEKQCRGSSAVRSSSWAASARRGALPSGQQGLDPGGEQSGPVEASPGFPERAVEPGPSSGGVTFGES